MLTCPMCKKSVQPLDRQCPTCKTDLSLLVDYVGHLQNGLEQAEALTRAGQLGPAIWTYLSVLEVDPENATARKQVGQVVTAVRQFDKSTRRRPWFDWLRRSSFSGEGDRDAPANRWWRFAAILLLILSALVAGYAVGHEAAQSSSAGSTETP